MTDITGFPWALNQPVPEGYGYSAEQLRAQHHDATSQGNGVGSPTSLKVAAQPAPDGTVAIVPGTATARSTYAGQSGQSYHVFFGDQATLPVSPTGSSSGGRKDLVIMQVCDPDHDLHWSYDGEYPIPPETAATMRFQRLHVLEGQDRNASLPYPFVRLAEINRPANTTIITNEHITDLRELANPRTLLHMRANNLSMADAQSLHTGTTVWPTQATHTVRIPEFATRVQIYAAWGTVHSHTASGSHGPASGQVIVRLALPGVGNINTQQSTWRTPGEVNQERFNIVLGDNRPIPEAFRGQDVQVELRGTKTYGPNIYMDGDSSWTLQLYFEQEIN